MSVLTRENIIEALSKIKDPARGKSLVEMGMVKDVKIMDKFISINLAVPALTTESKQSLIMHCNESLVTELGEEYTYNIHLLPDPKMFETMDEAPSKNIQNVIAVASGKGGVGKSTVAVNLACELAKQGNRVGLIDGDLYGPSIPTMMGLKNERPKMVNVGGKNKIVPLEAHGVHLISIGFIIEPEQAVVLRGPRLGGIMKQFLDECEWPDLDYLVIDLPPGTGDIQLTMVQSIAVTGALMVTTPASVSIDDALRAANMFRLENIQVPILGIVENMSWFEPMDAPGKRYHLFGQGGGETLANKVESKMLMQIPLIKEAGDSNDSGTPAVMTNNHPVQGYFTNLAQLVVEKTKERNAAMKPTVKVKMES